jgi:hypothetical protein
MTQKWNLQDIKPAQPRKRATPVGENMVKKKSTPVDASKGDNKELLGISSVSTQGKKPKSLLYAVVIFFVVVGGGVLASSLMGGADLTVYPRYREPNVNATFEASRTPQPKELAYEIMTLDTQGERQVSATGKEEVTAQAEGTILIYNAHQSKSIRLVTNTRFESNGLVFRITESAVVPGYTLDTSGEIVPGVITAQVFADDVGEEYNLSPSRFTIPGFTGEPEFDNLYAESIETFMGGFDGMRYIIDEDELQTATQALQMELRNSLLERISAEKPAGLILFNDAVTFTYESLPSAEYGEDEATIVEKVTMRIPLFKENEFAAFIAAATVPGYEGGDVRIEDYSVFTFDYTVATTSVTDISAVDIILFKLTGRPQIVWEYDGEQLKADLLTKNKTALTGVLGAYPAVEKAGAAIRPFWKTAFPDEVDEIRITEVIQ